MKNLIFTFLLVLPCIIAIICAAYLAANNVGGWGWFILLALFLGSVRIKIGD